VEVKAELCREKAWTADDDGLDDVVITGEVEDTRTDKLGRADGALIIVLFRFGTGGAEPGTGGGGGGSLLEEPLDGNGVVSKEASLRGDPVEIMLGVAPVQPLVRSDDTIIVAEPRVNPGFCTNTDKLKLDRL